MMSKGRVLSSSQVKRVKKLKASKSITELYRIAKKEMSLTNRQVRYILYEQGNTRVNGLVAERMRNYRARQMSSEA